MSKSNSKVGILDAIGDTPLVRLNAVLQPCHFQLYAKWEAANPGGSTKDRVALSILRHAISEGSISPKTTVIESSSGNMGIGLAVACAYLRIPFICVVDPKTTPMNIAILRAYGAQVEIVPAPDPETGEYLPVRLRRVEAIIRSRPNVFWVNQYANEYGAFAHHQTMSEIIADLGQSPDYLFCATSTCGTLRGCADYVRLCGLSTHIIAVDAVGSVIFNAPKAKRLLPGMGSSRIPELFSPDLSELCVHVTDWDCITGCRQLVRQEAILAGASSGGILAAVHRIKCSIPDGANCVMILCDRGERYLDTVYSDEWVSTQFHALPTDIFDESSTCAVMC